MESKILERGQLDVAIEDVQSLTHEEYALARKNGFGASDSSILCGVNLYKTLDELITEKNCKYITEEEKEVGEKAIVRKGFDLEPIILDKAFVELDAMDYVGVLIKPKNMYVFKDTPGLNVNYDGVFISEEGLFPVEAKLVSKYGEKYYNKSITLAEAKQVDMKLEGSDLETHIKRKALKLGIPAYYYTQVQQEIAGLDAPFGFLGALFDETWTFKMFYVPRDEYVITKIKQIAKENLPKIKRETI